MKKLVIKDAITKISFEIMADDTVKECTKEIEGRISKKNALKEIADIDYLPESVKIEVVTCTCKIPYDVLETIICASLYGNFSVGEQPWKTIEFKKPIYILPHVSDLGIKITPIVDAEDAHTIDGVNLDKGYVELYRVTVPEEVEYTIRSYFEVYDEIEL